VFILKILIILQLVDSHVLLGSHKKRSEKSDSGIPVGPSVNFIFPYHIDNESYQTDWSSLEVRIEELKHVAAGSGTINSASETAKFTEPATCKSNECEAEETQAPSDVDPHAYHVVPKHRFGSTLRDIFAAKRCAHFSIGKNELSENPKNGFLQNLATSITKIPFIFHEIFSHARLLAGISTPHVESRMESLSALTTNHFQKRNGLGFVLGSEKFDGNEMAVYI
jgi:hypothetical protein